MNSIVLAEKLWAAEGAIAGKFILYAAFRINFYCLSLIFHDKYYKRYTFPSRYLAVVPMVIEKLSKSYHATVFFLIISHLPPGHPIKKISSEFKMAAVSVMSVRDTKLRSLCKFLRNIAPNICGLGKPTDLKLGEVFSLRISNKITIP